MKRERLAYSIGDIADRYILEAGEAEARPRRAALPRAVLLAAVLAAALLLCAAAVYVASGGDLWRQVPDRDPVQVVRGALERQADKDYTVRITVERVAVDGAETARAREEYIGGGIAARRGWSGEYLAEHFTAVKAVYYAEYDHTRTTRSDGDVAMYFYLVRDPDSGRWSIVDNSGNLNLAESPAPTPAPTPDPAPTPVPGIQEQIAAYLTGRFTQKYAPYYDGLRYEMRYYEETVEDGLCTAAFLWTEYHLGKGWDAGSDQGVEQMVNYDLKVTAEVGEDGALDLNTVLVYLDESLNGPRDWVLLEDFSAPLPRARWREQVTAHLTARYTEMYADRCESGSLRCHMSYYEEAEENGVYTAAFVWGVQYPGGEGPYGPVTAADFYDLKVTAAVGGDGLLDMGTFLIVAEDKRPGQPDLAGPEG